MKTPDQMVLGHALSLHSQARNFELFRDGNEVNTLIFGEEHDKYSRLHAAWIRFVKPTHVLLEHLGGFQYDPSTSELSLQPGRTIASDKEIAIVRDIIGKSPEEYRSGIYPITQACAEVGASMVGCDLMPSEMAAWLKVKKYDVDNKEHMNELHRHRDNIMYDYLVKEQGSSGKSTLAVIGDGHAGWIYYRMLVEGQIQNYAYISHVSKD